MAAIDVLHPLDQPFGGTRASNWLDEALRSEAFARAEFYVAYAKASALLRLEAAMGVFRGRGSRLTGVIGIDQCGTTRQALDFVLATFDEAWIWHHPNPFVTFHPKVYLFEGAAKGAMVVGSCNLTPGGLEGNCEAAVRLRFDLPEDEQQWRAVRSPWSETTGHPNAIALTQDLIDTLDGYGLLGDEEKPSGPMASSRSTQGGLHAVNSFPSTPFHPPSALPSARTRALPRVIPPLRVSELGRATARVTRRTLPQALLIQIVPHANGEVFLSKQAMAQHPEFFGHPFSGRTTPKKVVNPSYPQRFPDPVTDWTVYDEAGRVKVQRAGYALNMVEYEAKSEIRVTISSDLRVAIPSGALLMMTRGSGSADYACDVHPPGSAQFETLLRLCDYTMPAGGGGEGRRFGWI